MANGLDLLFDPAVQAALPAICEKYGIARLEAFGSVVRDDFGPESDIDLLFTPAEGRFQSLRVLFDVKEELKVVFGRAIDLVDRIQLDGHWNYIFRDNALSTTRTVYESN